jgi:osmotically inducible protein OsmC
MADRTARASWTGDLFGGSGTVSAVSSGLFSDAPITWVARTEEPGGKTSPEELMAAAHAACFCMAFSNELSSRGHAPDRVAAAATATFRGGKVTTMRVEVEADIPGIDGATLQEALSAAEESCPVSNALRGNVDIQVSLGSG